MASEIEKRAQKHVHEKFPLSADGPNAFALDQAFVAGARAMLDIAENKALLLASLPFLGRDFSEGSFTLLSSLRKAVKDDK